MSIVRYVLGDGDEAFAEIPRRGPALLKVATGGRVVIELEMPAEAADRLRFDLDAGLMDREIANEPYATSHRP